MRITNETSMISEEVKEIVCNMCSRKVEQNKFGYFAEHVTIEKKWGYGSKYDGETHYIDLCQSCYERLQELLIVSPFKNVESSVYK